MNKKRYPILGMNKPRMVRTVYLAGDKNRLSRKQKMRILRAKYARMYAPEHAWSYPERIKRFKIK